MENVTPHFNQAIRRQDPAVFDFEHEVAELWRKYPGVENKVFFVDLLARKAVYPGDMSRKDDLQARLERDKGFHTIMDIYEHEERGSVCVPEPSTALRYIMILTGKHRFSFVSKDAPLAQETMLVFDHETGHAIIPNGTYEGNAPNLAESVADSHALIRHFQRYGTQSTAADVLGDARAFHMVFRRDRTSHFTTPVLEQIMACRNTIDWDRLTPDDTTRLARRFALQYSLNEDYLDILSLEFNKFHGMDKKILEGNALPLCELADMLLKTAHHSVFKYGMKALCYGIDQYQPDLRIAGGYWQDIHAQLAARQKRFDAAEPIIFGLGEGQELAVVKKPKSTGYTL